MNRRRIAITGAGGRVGSALVANLSSNNEFEVVAIVRNELAARILGPVKAEVRVGSVTDPESSRAMLAGCDTVINCALAMGWPRTARRHNESIIRNIANAHGVRLAVHFSTVAVYGTCVDPRKNSFERPQPNSDYGIDKLRLESDAMRLFAARKIRHYIVRLGHVYGPSQQLSFDVLARTSDPSFALPFGGNIPSNAVSIHAVIAAVRGMLNESQPSGVRNLVDSPQSSWREIYDFHTQLLGRPAAQSLSESDSEALRARYYREASQPIRTVLQSMLSSLGKVDLFAITNLVAFRRLVHGPLLRVPIALERSAKQTYVRRKARRAIRQQSATREAVPVRVCAPAMPGPCFETLDKRQAAAAMSEELRDWLYAMSNYRWNPTEMGLSSLHEHTTGKHPESVGARPFVNMAP